MRKRRERSKATTGGEFNQYFLASSFWCIGQRTNLVARFLAMIVGSALLSGISPGLAQGPNNGRLEPAAASIEGAVQVVAPQGQAEAVPGMLVKLTGISSAPESLSTAADVEGRYRFAKLSPGTYSIEVRLDGFKPFAETVVLRQGDAKIENVSLQLDKIVQKIEVRDKAAAVSTESTDSTATVSSRQFTTLPLAEQKFKAALPLVPGVVRTNDGQLNIKGARRRTRGCCWSTLRRRLIP